MVRLSSPISRNTRSPPGSLNHTPMSHLVTYWLSHSASSDSRLNHMSLKVQQTHWLWLHGRTSSFLDVKDSQSSVAEQIRKGAVQWVPLMSLSCRSVSKKKKKQYGASTATRRPRKMPKPKTPYILHPLNHYQNSKQSHSGPEYCQP